MDLSIFLIQMSSMLSFSSMRLSKLSDFFSMLLMLPIRKEKKLSPINYTGSYTLCKTYLQDHAEDILVGGAAGVVSVADGGERLQDEVN